MTSPAFQELVQGQERVQRVLWAALLVSIMLYGVVAHVVTGTPDTATPVMPALWAAFAMAAFGAGGLSLAWPRVALSDDRLRQAMAREAVPSGSRGAIRPASAALRERVGRLDARERRLYSVMSAAFTASIVRLAMNESIAIHGLVLSILSHDPRWFWIFAFPAIALDIAMFPRLDPLVERAQTLLDTPPLPQ
jgi:hypothetical protein